MPEGQNYRIKIYSLNPEKLDILPYPHTWPVTEQERGGTRHFNLNIPLGMQKAATLILQFDNLVEDIEKAFFAAFQTVPPVTWEFNLTGGTFLERVCFQAGEKLPITDPRTEKNLGYVPGTTIAWDICNPNLHQPIGEMAVQSAKSILEQLNYGQSAG
jgi:hypothetical protein